MSTTPHVERHFAGGRVVRDIVIGMSDGLTVPFALAAGLSGVATSNAIIVTAGVAEIVAGSIAMGLGGYLAARGEAEHYATERRREVSEVEKIPDIEAREVEEVFASYGLTKAELTPLVRALQRSPEAWVDFMMRFELGLEAPEPQRALSSAATIALSYVAGGLVPLAPYMGSTRPGAALWMSVATTITALLVFGYVKGRLTTSTPVRSALQTTLIGALAAAVAFGVARAID